MAISQAQIDEFWRAYNKNPASTGNINASARGISGGSVLGINNFPNGGGSGDSGSGSSGSSNNDEKNDEKKEADSLAEIARRAFQQKVDAYKNRLASAKQTVADYIKRINQGWEDTMTTIGNKKKEYGDIFNQGVTDIANSFEEIRGKNARNYADSELDMGLRNRALGRSGSGIEDWQKAKLLQAAMTGAAGNRITKESNEAENLRVQNERTNQLGDWEREAQRTKDLGYDQAAQLDREAELANEEDINTATNSLDTVLANILNYATTMGTTNSAVNSYQAPTFAQDTSGYSAVTAPKQGGAVLGTNTEQASNVTSPTSLVSYLKDDPSLLRKLGIFGNLGVGSASPIYR